MSKSFLIAVFFNFAIIHTSLYSINVYKLRQMLNKIKDFKDEAKKINEIGDDKEIYEFYKEKKFNPFKYYIVNFIYSFIYIIFFILSSNTVKNNMKGRVFPIIGDIALKGGSFPTLQLIYIFVTSVLLAYEGFYKNIIKKDYKKSIIFTIFFFFITLLNFYISKNLTVYTIILILISYTTSYIVKGMIYMKNKKCYKNK